ncbi:uncharacterized protein LOC114251350 [Bombyx mandarina]|uniref:Uncharacterized protein n=2 Tax=Bombyx TaxID=7090 RepID=A0A8R2AJM5_BOMMO|nr:uncharacterized protein LOC101741220 [Bombyx mori]XP_028041375.1 uncharacterized protein LOC114251350 [Bombyx mandarina]
MFQNEFAGNYCPKIQSRWNSYGNYKLIVWLWMLNETTLMFCPAEISHSGFYIHAVLHAISVIFIGMPLVYSEICIGQYMNGNVISMWNFFPIFRIAGYVVGISTQLMVYYRKKMIWKLFSPTDSWGPRDKILFKSRKMFVPEIMTREFLYRQVRLRGYYRSKKISHIKNQEYNEQESIFS